MPIDRTVITGTDSIIEGIDRVVVEGWGGISDDINGHIDGVNTHVGIERVI